MTAAILASVSIPAGDVTAPGTGEDTDRHERVFGPRYRALSIGIITVVLLVAFEGISVATAMPVAVRELDGLDLYAWSFTAFLVTSLVGMVLAGEASDRRGPLVPFLVAVATFGVGLVVAGTAQTMWVFILGRAVQGVGAGLNIVALYVVVARAYPRRCDRGSSRSCPAAGCCPRSSGRRSPAHSPTTRRGAGCSSVSRRSSSPP